MVTIRQAGRQTLKLKNHFFLSEFLLKVVSCSCRYYRALTRLAVQRTYSTKRTKTKIENEMWKTAHVHRGTKKEKGITNNTMSIGTIHETFKKEIKYKFCSDYRLHKCQLSFLRNGFATFQLCVHACVCVYGCACVCVYGCACVCAFVSECVWACVCVLHF